MAKQPNPLAQLLAQDVARYAPSLPLSVAQRQISQESGWNPAAHSGAGAEGIAQFMPATAAEYGVTDPYNPTQALTGYAKMMGRLLGNYKGDPNAVAEALSSYNSGNPTAYRDPGFASGQTYNYVRDILGGAGGAAAVPSTSGPMMPGSPAQPVAKPQMPAAQQTGLAQLLASAVGNTNQMVGLPNPTGLGNLLAKAAAGAGR